MPASELNTKQYATDDEHRFWMVHVDGTPGPKKKYIVFLDAVKDARHLSRKSHRKAHVLEVIGTFVSKTPEEEAAKEKFAKKPADPVALEAGQLQCAAP